MEKILQEDIIKQIKERLNGMKSNVEIIFYPNEAGQLNSHIEQMAKELSETSDKLTFKIGDKKDTPELTPAIELKGNNKGRIIFSGIPSGHEFATLLEDLLLVSGNDSKLSDETKEFLSKLEKPLQLKAFVTPTCPYCPAAVFLAHRMAMESNKVEAYMVEATEFPEESQKFQVSGVPHTIINNKQGGFVGAHPEPSAVEQIKKSLEE